MKAKCLETRFVLLSTIFLFFLFLFHGRVLAETFKAEAFSSPKKPLRVVLTWTPTPGVQYYNIYRKTATNASYPVKPLNQKPVTLYTDCREIKKVTPPGSVDWKIIEKSFAKSNKELFDPCNISTITPGSFKYKTVEILARARWKIAVVFGLAYDDQSVVHNTTYYYKICSVDSTGRVATLDKDVKVTAGVQAALPVPANVKTWSGDSRVLVYWPWKKSPAAAGYNIYRSTIKSGTYVRINDVPTASRFEKDPDGKYLAADKSSFCGFLDFLRWDKTTGKPAAHKVNKSSIMGPMNGKTYYYRVKSVDIFGNEGKGSSPVSAVPVDKTPPQAPTGVTVTADNVNSTMEIRWPKVTRDISNHVETPEISGYKVYRYNDAGDPNQGAKYIGFVSHPKNPGIITVTAKDSSSDLRPLYGEKTYWYRVEAIDAANNTGSRSAAVGAFLKDITPPAHPGGVIARGFDDYIDISWDLNSEPDLDGYSVYRSLCHLGKWKECQKKVVGEDSQTVTQAPCSGSFMLLGYVFHADAKELIRKGKPLYRDKTIPSNSPVCYAYLIKALDKSQNISGSLPVPAPDEEIVCQRLRDSTPPEPAFISKLMARDTGILVEWIGAPVQDIKAYHVYRADKEQGPYTWVGGMTVGDSSTPAVKLSRAYEVPPRYTVGCEKIPLFLHEGMSAGSFLDESVVPHHIYWYKVVGIDQSGNETLKKKAVPISTFTYTTALPGAPVITAVVQVTNPCGLQVKWTPLFDSSTCQGFAVFRSNAGAGVYNQIGSLVQGNTFLDTTVVIDREYWYKLVKIDSDGNLSPLSAPMMGKCKISGQ